MFTSVKVRHRSGTYRALGVLGLVVLASMGLSQVNVTTYHNDIGRTGLNSSETILKPSNVNQSQFGLIYSWPVDGKVVAQPLYLSGVVMPGGAAHNLALICTEHNSVYAFDADSPSTTPLWQVNLGPSVPNWDTGTDDINPELGITGTPVIYGTGASATIYVVAKTKEVQNSNTVYVQRVHALSVTTGADVITPAVIQGQVKGTGDGNDGNGNVPFNALIQNNRPALLIAGLIPRLYVAFASHGDNGPYHGWLFAYDLKSLQLFKIANTTPNALTDPSGYPIAAGGIWQSGSGPASDGASIYFATGNGTFNPSNGSYGDSIMRMLASTLDMIDYFTPTDQQNLDDGDGDLGSGGVMLIPAGFTGTRSLLVQSGKEGTVYLIDRNSLGHYSTSQDRVVQELPQVMGGIWGAPAYFNGNIYYGPSGGPLLSYKLVNGKIPANGPSTNSPDVYGYPGPTPSVSSNGNTNGIVWAIETDAYSSGGNSSLHAYDATNLGNELYNSNNTNGRDVLGGAVKFSTPTIANGKVFVGTANVVDVFGVGQWASAPSLTTSGNYLNSVRVEATDPTPGSKIYYTTDGSIPTATNTGSSHLYTGPITFTSSVTLNAKAFAAGYGASPTVTGNYQVNAVIGQGQGLRGNYYTNYTDPSSPFPSDPFATRVDQQLNFNWNGGSPISNTQGIACGGDNWGAEWTGHILAETTSPYTFYTTSDDGVRVTVNGQMIINDWTYHPPTVDQGTINLQGGYSYTIVVDYFQGGGGSLLQLAWSAPGMPWQVVPQSQLYVSRFH